MKKENESDKAKELKRLAKIDELLNLDVGLLLDKELKKIKSERTQFARSPEVQNFKKFKQDIYDKVLPAFEENSDSCYDISESLHNLLIHSQIEVMDGATIFKMLCFFVGQKKDRLLKENPTERDIINIDHVLNSLHSSAIAYCRLKLCEERKDGDLPELLVYVKEIQRRMNDKFNIDPATNKLHLEYGFISKAASGIQNDVERTIAREKEALDLRKQLDFPENLNGITSKEASDALKKHSDLTLDRAVLAMSYLLDELNVKCPLSKKKEFIDFLTPYSPNTIKTKLENLHDKQEKNFVEYKKDLDIISKYFENLGLGKIVEQIKKDLEFE